MEIIEQFEIAKKNHALAPSYSSYSALANFAEKYSSELSLKEIQIAILRNFTFEPLIPLIAGELALCGLKAKTYLGDFDTIPENVLNPESKLYQSKPDIIIITQWLETLSPAISNQFLLLNSEDVEVEIKRIVDYVDGLFKAIRSKTNAVVLINNFPLPSLPTLGILDTQSENYQTYSITKLNQELLKISKQFAGVYWVDYLGLFSRHGYLNSKDEKHWQMSRSPFSRTILNHVAAEYGKFFKAISGKAKKCLVLDCDNTLWGGIVGEDGIMGLKLGTSHPGQSFKDFQQEILNYFHKGVILALCSKNNEEDVLEVLDKHPDMILKRKHFSTWQINWQDKASNLKQIAHDLNIGLDSLVFVDDNPFECNWIRENLPMVGVIELGKDIVEFRKKLNSPGYFDSLIFSLEDKNRSSMYALDKHRKELLRTSGSLSEYLHGLEILSTVGELTDKELSRVTQLTQKTNQFNLTTKRYTEADLNYFLTCKDYEVYYLQLQDRVSDLGIIGAVIVKFEHDTAEIDTFLLSCRALGRGAEDTLLSLIINRAKLRGCQFVKGLYVKTARNSQVKDFFERHDFKLVSEIETGSIWNLEINSKKDLHKLYPDWIKINPVRELEIYS